MGRPLRCVIVHASAKHQFCAYHSYLITAFIHTYVGKMNEKGYLIRTYFRFYRSITLNSADEQSDILYGFPPRLLIKLPANVQHFRVHFQSEMNEVPPFISDS